MTTTMTKVSCNTSPCVTNLRHLDCGGPMLIRRENGIGICAVCSACYTAYPLSVVAYQAAPFTIAKEKRTSRLWKLRAWLQRHTRVGLLVTAVSYSVLSSTCALLSFPTLTTLASSLCAVY